MPFMACRPFWSIDLNLVKSGGFQSRAPRSEIGPRRGLAPFFSPLLDMLSWTSVISGTGRRDFRFLRVPINTAPRVNVTECDLWDWSFVPFLDAQCVNPLGYH